jgi:hypothetical protein
MNGIPAGDARLAWEMGIAKVAYEANRAYCQMLGDHSFGPWEEAPSWQRESNLDGVRFHFANPRAGPEASHENWLRKKRAEGWVYGPTKNPETKEHPCCVAFQQLSKEQQRKDVLFRSIVHAFISDGLQEAINEAYKPEAKPVNSGWGSEFGIEPLK